MFFPKGGFTKRVPQGSPKPLLRNRFEPEDAKRIPQGSPKLFLRNLGRPSAAHTKGGGRLRRPPPFVCPRFLEKTLGGPFGTLGLGSVPQKRLGDPCCTLVVKPTWNSSKIGPVPLKQAFGHSSGFTECSGHLRTWF